MCNIYENYKFDPNTNKWYCKLCNKENIYGLKSFDEALKIFLK